MCTDASLCVAIASLAVTSLIGLITFWLMHRQLNLMHRQDELLNRRAKLRLTYDWIEPTPQDGNRWLAFRVHNDGTRSASDFYWHVWIPSLFSGQFGG